MDRALARGRPRQEHRDRDLLLVHIQAGHPRMDNLHDTSPRFGDNGQGRATRGTHNKIKIL